jgi:TolB protein
MEIQLESPSQLSMPTLEPLPKPVTPQVAIKTSEPAVTISPTSGPSGTLVQVTASGFPANAPVWVALGPVNSEYSQVAQGVTDVNGGFTAQVSVMGEPGMNFIFAVVAEGQTGVLAPEQFQVVGVTGTNPVVNIAPTSGPSGTLVYVTATGFPANAPVRVALGPVNSEFSQVAQGVTDANGVFLAQVPAQGEPGMNLVFAVMPEGQPGVLSPEQFQVIFAVPNPQPTPILIPTPTPYMDTWTTFSSLAFAISLQYPADWQPAGYGSPETGEIRFAGINGFFHINSMDGDSIDSVAAAEAGHRLQPYGSQPTIEILQIQGQEARLILPSSDQPTGMQSQAALIVRYPPVTTIVWSPRYFVLWADWPHIRAIAKTLRFTN